MGKWQRVLKVVWNWWVTRQGMEPTIPPAKPGAGGPVGIDNDLLSRVEQLGNAPVELFVAGADGGDLAGGVDHVDFREAVDGPLCGHCEVGAVAGDGPGEGAVGRFRERGVRRGVAHDGQDGNSIAEFFLQFAEAGVHRFARAAAGEGELDHDDAAALVGELPRFAVDERDVDRRARSGRRAGGVL